MTAVGQCTVVEVKRRQRKSGKEVLEITGTAVANSDEYSRKRSKQAKRMFLGEQNIFAFQVLIDKPIAYQFTADSTQMLDEWAEALSLQRVEALLRAKGAKMRC